MILGNIFRGAHKIKNLRQDLISAADLSIKDKDDIPSQTIKVKTNKVERQQRKNTINKRICVLRTC